MKAVGEENIQKLESFVYLQIIDQSWKDHWLALDGLRDSVSLRGYGQRSFTRIQKKSFTALLPLLT